MSLCTDQIILKVLQEVFLDERQHSSAVEKGVRVMLRFFDDDAYGQFFVIAKCRQRDDDDPWQFHWRHVDCRARAPAPRMSFYGGAEDYLLSANDRRVSRFHRGEFARIIARQVNE